MSSSVPSSLSIIDSGACRTWRVVEGLGTYQNVFVQGSSLSVGFNGMAVSLGCQLSSGILFAAFLFAVLVLVLRYERGSNSSRT